MQFLIYQRFCVVFFMANNYKQPVMNIWAI